MNKHDLKKLESEKRRRSSPSSLLSSDPRLEVQLAVLDVLRHLGFVLVVLQVFRDVRKLELVVCRLKYWPQSETGNDNWGKSVDGAIVLFKLKETYDCKADFYTRMWDTRNYGN